LNRKKILYKQIIVTLQTKGGNCEKTLQREIIVIWKIAQSCQSRDIISEL